MTRELLGREAPVNVRNSDGDTPLHLAVSDDMHACKFSEILLKKNADPKIQNEEGQTPLHLVKCVVCAKRLGVASNTLDKKGRTPIMDLMKNPRGEATALLRAMIDSKDANLGTCSKDGLNCL